MAQQVNITDWYAGEDRVFRFTVLDLTGAVVDVTGWTVTFELRAAVGDVSAVLTKTVGSGVVLTDPTNGVIDVTITRTDSSPGGVLIDASASSASHVYGLARTNSNAWTMLAYGTAVLTRAGTK